MLSEKPKRKEHSKIFHEYKFYVDKGVENREKMENVVVQHGGTVANIFSTNNGITHIISSKKVHSNHVHRKDKDSVSLSQALYDEARQNEIWPILETEIRTQLLNVCERCGDDMLERTRRGTEESTMSQSTTKKINKGASYIQISELGLRDGFLVFDSEEKIPKPNTGNVNKTYGIFSSNFSHTLKSELYHCECCGKHVVEPNAHFVTTEHKKFRENESNYKKLDELFKGVKQNGVMFELGLLKPIKREAIVQDVKMEETPPPPLTVELKKEIIVIMDGVNYTVHSTKPPEIRTRKRKLETPSIKPKDDVEDTIEVSFKAPQASPMKPKTRHYIQTKLSLPENKK
jgi:hypothetical protein